MVALFDHLHLLFSSTPLQGPEQMALDEVLLMRSSTPLLRCYHWENPWVTFGYFQEWRSVQLLFPGYPLVRRFSGGGALLHEGDMTFSLIVPAGYPAARRKPIAFYQALHQCLVKTLRTFSIQARLVTSEDVEQGHACFRAPSLHDVMVEHQKIAGGAQRRRAGRLLHQGSLKFPSGVHESLKKTDFVKQFFLSFSNHLSSKVLEIEEESFLMEEACTLAQEKYRRIAWTQQR